MIDLTESDGDNAAWLHKARQALEEEEDEDTDGSS